MSRYRWTLLLAAVTLLVVGALVWRVAACDVVGTGYRTVEWRCG